MSHYVTSTGRPYAECDDPIRDPVTGELSRCGRRTFGIRDRFESAKAELDLFSLPRGWAVAPYPDDFDHGATRRSLLDGSALEPMPWLVGIVGDCHTCPACSRRSARVA